MSLKTLIGTAIFILYLSTLAAVSSTVKTERLLVSIEPTAAFSAEEFAQASSATQIPVEIRNPYKALQNVRASASNI